MRVMGQHGLSRGRAMLQLLAAGCCLWQAAADAVTLAETCPERFTGGAELSDAQCGICGKNYFTQDGECDLECDMFITCGGHGRCDGLGAGCICYSGFEGTDCGMRG